MKSRDFDSSVLLGRPLDEEQRAHIRREAEREGGAIDIRVDRSDSMMEFAGLHLLIGADVFPPTPAAASTLGTVAAALEAWHEPVVVDVGTGSGALALALARRRPDATIHGTDVAAAAVRCARENALRLGLENVVFHRGSLLAPIPAEVEGRVDVVVANLPYVPADRASAFEGMVPVGTAVGPAKDGLGLVRRLAADARRWLAPDGALFLQMAGFQARGVADEIRELGYLVPEVRPSEEGALLVRADWPGRDG